MHIRGLKKEDYPAIDRLMADLHQLHVEGRPDLYVPMEHIYSAELYEKMMMDHIMLGAEEHGKLIGLCICSRRTRTAMKDGISYYMEDLFVAPEHRGKGVAKALFRAAERAAKASGAARLDLMVWSFNRDAIGFYRAMGMTDQRIILEKHL